MSKILKESFFNNKAEIVAKKLLGKFLVRKKSGKIISSMITETEAYVGPEDLASHASRGLTERTKIMFGHPGRFYVYLIYGMYQMVNIVTGKFGHPAGVLIRGVESASGPGRLSKFFKVGKSLNGKPATRKNGFWFEDREIKISERKIKRTARIGVDYAGPIWSKKKLRFLIE